MVALYNIRSGWNGGLESALKVMAEMDIDFGILVDSKITAVIYTCFLSSYYVFVSNAVSI